MAKEIGIEELAALEYQEPNAVKARKRTAREIASIGSYYAEKELQNQERAYKRSSNYQSFKPDNGISDALPYQAPKRHRANPNKRRNLSLATVAISLNLRDPALYFYGRSIAFYANAYKHGYITRGEWREIVNNVKLMGPEKRDRSWREGR